MIRPVRFGYNAQTAVNNAFQVPGADPEQVQGKALEEFNDFVEKLRYAGVDVTVVDDEPEPHTPDSIFPNNWISFHEDGTIVLYPMYAENRRLERRDTILEVIEKKFELRRKVDYTAAEADGVYLEGTGSMVLDRENKIAYACLSPRTDLDLFKKWCNEFGFKPIVFAAADQNGTPVYHTNVLMAVADRYVVLCAEAITDADERRMVINTIKESGKDIVEIGFDQMGHFAGNMLQVHNFRGEKILVMSTQAWNSLGQTLQNKLLTFNKILHSQLDTIERNGGGSARCMMAEVHLPLRQT
ncbi:MAG TPA: arginine deiminase-related protein [Phnomibacter sp.]|nr:arginine deiminase-related protein [Phnomibacter sp.]